MKRAFSKDIMIGERERRTSRFGDEIRRFTKRSRRRYRWAMMPVFVRAAKARAKNRFNLIKC